MEIHLARQPIFDRQKRVHAYELLFRLGRENVFVPVPPSEATSSVIINCFCDIGLAEVASGKPVFINADAEMLSHMTALPPTSTVIEILETVEATTAVLDTCRELRALGYPLALDDVVYGQAQSPFFDLVDIVKVDFLENDSAARRAIAEELGPSGVKLLAEKVENLETFAEAMALGYDLFQGFFFSRPHLVSAKTAAPLPRNRLRLLVEAQRAKVDYDRLERLLKEEPAFAIKFLRFCNSALFGLRHEVTSLRHGLALMGDRTIRKWVSLLALARLGHGKPVELLYKTLIRAKFLENLALAGDLPYDPDELFVLGLLSLLDVVLDRPLGVALADIPVSQAIKNALLAGSGPLAAIFRYATAYEVGDWDRLETLQHDLERKLENVRDAYLDAIKWATECLEHL